MGKYGLHDRNDEIISISEIYEVSLGIYIVSGGETTKLITVGQDETERNESLFHIFEVMKF
jgi:hypothetical protein